MGFLGNSDIILTISVLFLGAGLVSLLTPRRTHLAMPAVFIATLLLYLVLHRYGSRLGSGSPALQLILLVMLFAPLLLRFLLSRGEQGAHEPGDGLLFVFAGLMAIFWIVFLFSPWTAAWRTAAHPAVFVMMSYALLPATFRAPPMGRAGSTAALMLLYAFLFSFGTGSLEEVPESTGVRAWNGVLWALPFAAFVLTARSAVGLPARLAFMVGFLPCPLLILWAGLPRGEAPGLEFHVWWASLALLLGMAIALEMHLKKATRA